MQNLKEDCNGDSDEDQAPGELCLQDPLDDHLHHHALRGGDLGAAKPPGAVEQVQDGSDGQRGGDHADQFADLLLFRGGAHQKSGFQIL